MTIITAHCTYNSLQLLFSAQHTFHYSEYFSIAYVLYISNYTSYVLTHNLLPLAMDLLSYLQADTALPFNVNIHIPSFTSITMS